MQHPDALTPLKGVVERAVDGFERARRDSHRAAAAPTPKATGDSDGPRLSRNLAVPAPQPVYSSAKAFEHISAAATPAKEARPVSSGGAEENSWVQQTQSASTPKGQLHGLFEGAAVTPAAVNTTAASANAPKKHATTPEETWSLGVHAVGSGGIVRVEVVVPSSPCAGTLAAGDVLHSCNGKPVDSVESLRAALPGILCTVGTSVQKMPPHQNQQLCNTHHVYNAPAFT
jgi:hypothetical protein